MARLFFQKGDLIMVTKANYFKAAIVASRGYWVMWMVCVLFYLIFPDTGSKYSSGLAVITWVMPVFIIIAMVVVYIKEKNSAKGGDE